MTTATGIDIRDALRVQLNEAKMTERAMEQRIEELKVDKKKVEMELEYRVAKINQWSGVLDAACTVLHLSDRRIEKLHSFLASELGTEHADIDKTTVVAMIELVNRIIEL